MHCPFYLYATVLIFRVYNSMTFRTACSAAMVALHEACVAIGRGDCSSAVVGGVNLILAPGMTQAMSEQGVLAPDGSCKTFSADADGYGRGEAVSAVYIKPLHAAVRDGNPVRAIIKQTATNVCYFHNKCHYCLWRTIF